MALGMAGSCCMRDAFSAGGCSGSSSGFKQRWRRQQPVRLDSDSNCRYRGSRCGGGGHGVGFKWQRRVRHSASQKVEAGGSLRQLSDVPPRDARVAASPSHSLEQLVLPRQYRSGGAASARMRYCGSCGGGTCKALAPAESEASSFSSLFCCPVCWSK